MSSIRADLIADEAADRPGGRPTPNDSEAFLLPIDIKILLELSPLTLEATRRISTGPKWDSRRRRTVRHRRSDLLDIIASRSRPSTPDHMAPPLGGLRDVRVRYPRGVRQ